MPNWMRRSRASKEERGASRRAFLRSVGGATAAVVGAQVVDLPALVSGQASRTAAAEPVRTPLEAAASAGGASLAAGATSSAPSRMVPAYPAPWPAQTALETLTLDAFNQHLDTSFRVYHDAGVLDLVLSKATPSPQQAEAAPSSFTLLFRGPDGSRLEQGTYKLQHETLGVFDLFIVPIGQAADAQYYEAIFSRAAV